MAFPQMSLLSQKDSLSPFQGNPRPPQDPRLCGRGHGEGLTQEPKWAPSTL